MDNSKLLKANGWSDTGLHGPYLWTQNDQDFWTEAQALEILAEANTPAAQAAAETTILPRVDAPRPAPTAIDPAELDVRFAALRASNFVVRSLCDSKGYDLRGLLDGFAGRPDLYEQVLDKLQIREVTMFVDTASAEVHS